MAAIHTHRPSESKRSFRFKRIREHRSLDSRDCWIRPPWFKPRDTRGSGGGGGGAYYIGLRLRCQRRRRRHRQAERRRRRRRRRGWRVDPMGSLDSTGREEFDRCVKNPTGCEELGCEESDRV
eukprot:3250277-Prymnesium_polylepis.1